MKIKTSFKTIIFFGLILAFSCSQDPIFFTISEETAPLKARIPASPTNMVEFKREYTVSSSTKTVHIMYVASGSLHWYAKDKYGDGSPGWDSKEYDISQPGGRVISLAASSNHLYALCVTGSGKNTELKRIGKSTTDTWKKISIDGSDNIQSIYYAGNGTNGYLFAGAMNADGSEFGIYYLDDANEKLIKIKSATGFLTGAAASSSDYYLCTVEGGKNKGGIFKGSMTPTPVTLTDVTDKNGGNKNRSFMGMIKLEDNSIIAVERDGGTLFKVNNSEFETTNLATGKYATGALAVWHETSTDKGKVLAAGIQGGLVSSLTASNFTHGYVEFDLDASGSLTTGPHSPPTITVDGLTERYTATIGKHPVNRMYQTSDDIDSNLIFFASTQTAGLWSYRIRDGEPQWNAEE